MKLSRAIPILALFSFHASAILKTSAIPTCPEPLQKRHSTPPEANLPHPSSHTLTPPTTQPNRQKLAPTTASTPPPAIPTPCGSRGLPSCSTEQKCLADPLYKSWCTPEEDCPGICVMLNGPACAGGTGQGCPTAGQYCVGVPDDDCDPRTGGVKCAGVCITRDGK